MPKYLRRTELITTPSDSRRQPRHVHWDIADSADSAADADIVMLDPETSRRQSYCSLVVVTSR
jgi:hypothetical protein